MAENSIQSPRLDRGFVTVKINGQVYRGELTDYSYALLWNLIKRVGGTTGEIIDMDGIHGELDAAAMAPIPQFVPQPNDDPGPPAIAYLTAETPQDGRLEALQAEVAEIRNQLNGLLQGYQL